MTEHSPSNDREIRAATGYVQLVCGGSTVVHLGHHIGTGTWSTLCGRQGTFPLEYHQNTSWYDNKPTCDLCKWGLSNRER